MHLQAALAGSSHKICWAIFNEQGTQTTAGCGGPYPFPAAAAPQRATPGLVAGIGGPVSDNPSLSTLMPDDCTCFAVIIAFALSGMSRWRSRHLAVKSCTCGIVFTSALAVGILAMAGY